MRTVSRIIALALLAGSLAGVALAQRPRSVSSDPVRPGATAMPTPAPAPPTVKAKYEGGVFGYDKKLDGTLTFDDANNRLVFRKAQKEILFIPYGAVTSAFADTKSRRPKAATVVGSLPSIFTLPAQFIKHKVQYLTLQYRDPDTNASGVTSFKLENKEMLASVLNTLAVKASLMPRGDIYVKRKQQDDEVAKPDK
ncbi:MAG TPA: hypothetical protein VGO91_18015 [Pyrinomonadaceae bacterium]|jgi:hypothetical protein|nr:hypothetical protein [Pyrinomonadaceae bacterium]